MSSRRVLYFTSSNSEVYLWRGGLLELEGRFAIDEAGIEEFRGFVKMHAKSLFYILADLAGEDFHDEMIPSLRGNDRQAVIERRLAQRYRDSRLAATLPLGSVAVAGGRRNERLLLASFTNTQQFSPWLEALSEAGAKLAGVYSVPLLAPALAARLAPKLGAKSSRMFVVSVNSAGLRQSYLDAGKLRFARLEITVEMSADALAAFVRSETLRLAQYLSSLRVLPRDGPPITAIVIAPPGQRALFEQALPSDGRLTFRTLDLAEAARLVGVKRGEKLGAEQLYLHLVVARTPKDQFARGEDRRGYLVWQLQRGALMAGALGFAACTAFAGVKWIDVTSMREQTGLQRLEAHNAEQEYQRITATFPVTLTTTENLKAAVSEFRSIAERTAMLGPALAYLSKALEQFPQIEIDQLEWRVERSGAGEKLAGTPATPSLAERAGTGTTQVLVISGHVSAMQRSDYRAITAKVQRFADALRADTSYEVLRTQLPFDVSPGGTLSGDIGSGDDSDTPRFTITVTRRIVG